MGRQLLCGRSSLCSAPKIFTAVADALQWAMLRSGVSVVEHWISGRFYFHGPPRLPGAQGESRPYSGCVRGRSSGSGQAGGPNPQTDVSRDQDGHRGRRAAPPCREAIPPKGAASSVVTEAIMPAAATQIAHRRHSTTCLPGGQAWFLRRMIDLLRTPSATKPHHHIRLNREFRADLQWLETFVVHWNGVAMFPCVTAPTSAVAWGCVAWSGSSWFQLEWPQGAQNHHAYIL